MGGRAAACEFSRKERRRGINLLEDMRSRKERVCEGVVILATVLASAKRGHSIMMWVGVAELLAFEFDGAPGEIPTYRPGLRVDDQTQAVLSTC